MFPECSLDVPECSLDVPECSLDVPECSPKVPWTCLNCSLNVLQAGNFMVDLAVQKTDLYRNVP